MVSVNKILKYLISKIIKIIYTYWIFILWYKMNIIIYN